MSATAKAVQAALADGRTISDEQIKRAAVVLFQKDTSTVTETVTALLDSGIDVNADLGNEVRLLHVAAATGNLGAARLLLKEGADTQKAYNRETPLHIAAKNGETRMVKLLIEHGADVNAAPSIVSSEYVPSDTPLHMAAASEIARILIEAGARVNATDHQGLTPLHTASMALRPEVAKVLLKAGADVNAEDGTGQTPIFWAAGSKKKKALNVVRTLLEGNSLGQKPDLNVMGEHGDTPLDTAKEFGRSDVADLLASNGGKKAAPPSNTEMLNKLQGTWWYSHGATVIFTREIARETEKGTWYVLRQYSPGPTADSMEEVTFNDRYEADHYGAFKSLSRYRVENGKIYVDNKSFIGDFKNAADNIGPGTYTVELDYTQDSEGQSQHYLEDTSSEGAGFLTPKNTE